MDYTECKVGYATLSVSVDQNFISSNVTNDRKIVY